MKSAAEILLVKEPELLFTGDPTILDKEYKEMRVFWHPDRNTDSKATEVFMHLTSLYEFAIKKLKAGIWSRPNYLNLTDLKTAKTYEIHYAKKHDFELGAMYISKSVVTFVVDSEYKDLYQNAIRMMKFKYSSPRMEEQMSHSLPKIKMFFETIGNHGVLVLEKDPNLILLRDLYDYYKHQIDHRHTAWILSTLYNLACYFRYSGEISNNGLSLDTYFIHPEKHGGTILGGWWYGARKNEKLKALPMNTIGCIPSPVLAEKKFDYRIDLELIRGMGRELVCGDANKIHLIRNHKTCPKALKAWLSGASVGHARHEYEEWQNVLTRSFGPRKFIKMEASFNNVYTS